MSGEYIAAIDAARRRREIYAQQLLHELRRTILMRAERPDDDDAVSRARADFSTDAVALVAPLIEAWEVLQQIIYASDGCVGHRNCAHSMEPWQRARALMMAEDEREMRRRGY